MGNITNFVTSLTDGPLNIFRSSETNPENTYAVGAYLFRKMGRLGLLVHMQEFKDNEEESHGQLNDDVSIIEISLFDY